MHEKQEQWRSLLARHVPQCGVQLVAPEKGDASLLVKADSLLDVCKVLKDDHATQFHVLQVISGVDFSPEFIEVNYILASYTLNHELILKIKLSRQNPRVQSVASLWAAADFQERECYDMLGVMFENHPDFRRILCPDDWEGYALRKDYVASKSYRGMEVYPEEKMNFPDREFAAKQKMSE